MMASRQHCSLLKDVEVVMINGLSPWGNNYLIPRGPLREPLKALCRAQIVFIHHADLVSYTELNAIVSTVHKISPSIPTFSSRFTPLFLFDVKNPLSKLPLSMVTDMVILCVSAIGCPDAFIHLIKMIGPLHADRVDFSDHHSINLNDINLIRKGLAILQNRFSIKPVVLITEKDYDRNPTILKEVNDFQILVNKIQEEFIGKIKRTRDEEHNKEEYCSCPSSLNQRVSVNSDAFQYCSVQSFPFF
ncbi:hypothetical protein HPP92_012036 [Vanilla planifolia]|uniref:tetraacyldisaccharide 4'-kinase n=1 Tax=Vanilla planifolia TaxID=51239 RepID=A0A835V3D5_VANPL|nr:hypothetical protein HPP92_012036 [Vanilla planifolia]